MGVVHSKTKISEERKDYLQKKFQYAASEFRRVATRSNHSVPKEQQLSVDLGNKKVFGIIDRILKWIENKFKYFFPRYNLFPEVGTKERKIPETDTKVKYFTPEEQDEHALHIREENGDRKLYDSKGHLYDTTNKVSKGQKGCVAYVITLDGRLITHEHINVGKNTKYAYRHSTLAGGKPVICSGLMQVNEEGEITYIDNNSGHYKPTSANLYKAVEKFKELFSKDAKVHCLTNWSILRQDLPFLCRLPDTKEPVKQFLERMEKRGKDGLTRYERNFSRIKKDNEEYKQELHFVNYKSPTAEPPNKPTIHKKHKLKFSSYINSYLKFLKEFDEDHEVRKVTLEHSIRKVIGANYGHKPKIELVNNKIVQDGKIQEGEKIIGINVTFHYKDDYNRFIRLLALKKFKYSVSEEDANKLTNTPIRSNKYVVSIDTDDANKFIKNILKININIEELASALKPFEKKVASEHSIRKTLIESSIRKITEASSFDRISHMPKIEHNHTRVLSITFLYEDDYNKFYNKFIEVLGSQRLNYTSNTQVSKYIITVSTEQADKFISHYLGSNINIRGMVASTLSNLEPLNTNYCNAIQ